MLRRIYGKAVCSLEAFGASYGTAALRISIGIIYLWFGVPKFFHGASPAEALAVDTTERLTFGVIEGGTASVLTGLLETVIGILLMSGRAIAPTIIMLIGHMAGACTPLFIFPDRTWKEHGVATLEGQYILKNLVVIAAALVIIGHSKYRGNRTPPPDGPLLEVAAPRAVETSLADSQPHPVPAAHRAESLAGRPGGPARRRPDPPGRDHRW